VDAAVRAARLLAAEPGARILDIGSGVGKFCIVAAASTDARVTGIEHRVRLVEIASAAAARLGVDVTFKRGTLDDCDPREVDGVYMFNPFAENLCAREDRIDQSVELSEARFFRDLAATRAFLETARVGTRVVTYCGFGGDLPSSYALALRERCAGNLELWVKTDGAPAPAPGAPR
jgi:predicted RNA methylase